MASMVALHVIAFALVGPASPGFAIAASDATAQVRRGGVPGGGRGAGERESGARLNPPP